MLESNASSPRSKRKLNQGVWQLGMIEDLISWKVELIYSSQGTFKAHHYFNYILLSENWSIFLRILWSRYMIVSMFNLPINIYIPNYYIYYKSLIERSMIRFRIRRIAICFAFDFGILKIFHLFRMLNGVYLLAMIILFTLSRKCIYFISSKERVPLRKLIWLSSNSNKRMRKDASKPN